jgi:hypothetical protein
MYSRRGPQESAQIFLNTSRSPEAANGTLRWRHALQRIETERLRDVRHIEVDKVVAAPFGHPCKRAFDQVAMRVDQRNAAALLQVLPEEGRKQRRFPSSGLPDHVHVMAPVGLADAEAFAVIAPVGLRQQRNRVVLVHASMFAAQRSFAQTAHPAALAYFRRLVSSRRGPKLSAVPLGRTVSMRKGGRSSCVDLTVGLSALC